MASDRQVHADQPAAQEGAGAGIKRYGYLPQPASAFDVCGGPPTGIPEGAGQAPRRIHGYHCRVLEKAGAGGIH